MEEKIKELLETYDANSNYFIGNDLKFVLSEWVASELNLEEIEDALKKGYYNPWNYMDKIPVDEQEPL